jgi:hypothetical protein
MDTFGGQKSNRYIVGRAYAAPHLATQKGLALRPLWPERSTQNERALIFGARISDAKPNMEGRKFCQK